MGVAAARPGRPGPGSRPGGVCAPGSRWPGSRFRLPLPVLRKNMGRAVLCSIFSGAVGHSLTRRWPLQRMRS
eukprot:4086950-Alexandrium_andersonii.AAC.1